MVPVFLSRGMCAPMAEPDNNVSQIVSVQMFYMDTAIKRDPSYYGLSVNMKRAYAAMIQVGKK